MCTFRDKLAELCSIGVTDSRWWKLTCSMVLFMLLLDNVGASSLNICEAGLRIAYDDPVHDRTGVTMEYEGRYGLSNLCEEESGQVVHVLSGDQGNHACFPLVNVPPRGRWIALVRRGGCKFTDKIYTSTTLHNASAVVVYNNLDEDELLSMHHKEEEVVAVFISKADGEKIAGLADSGIKVMMNISVTKITIYTAAEGVHQVSTKRSPLLAVSLSIVGLLILGLLLLIVYAVRRAKCMNERRHGPSLSYRPPGVLCTQQGLLMNDAAREQSNTNQA